MNPVKQTLADILYGNCLQACIASVMEKPLDYVPNVMLFEDHWWESLITWLGVNGYSAQYIEGSPPNDDNYYVVSMKFKRHGKGISHALVMKNGNVEHDPWLNIDYTYDDAKIHGYYKLIPSRGCNIKPKIKHEEKGYFYSEGYIYKGTDTICKLYGTNKEMEDISKTILTALNK